MSLEKIIDQMPLPWLPLPTTQSSLSDVTRQMYGTLSFDLEWKELRYIPWRFFYLDYHHLQQDIFYGNLSKRLETEWNKVYDFYILKKGEIERRIESTKKTRNEQEIKILFTDIHQLYHFAKLNYCGFIRLFMQYHRLFGSPPTDLLRRLIVNKPFWDHSTLLFSFTNQLNTICINEQSKPQSIQINPSHQSFFSAVENMSFRKNIHPLSNSNSSSTINSCETALSIQLDFPKHEKTVKKYWVHPDNIVEVMLYMSNNKMILQDENNNPSFTYMATDEIGHPQGIKSKFIAMSSQSIHHIHNHHNNNNKRNNQFKVTTTYMDSIDLNDYTERIIGKPIKTTRVRWFDTIEPDKYISLEQKVYYNGQRNNIYKGYKGLGKEPQQNHDPLEQHDWIQQRLWFKYKHFNPWMNGTYSISNVLDKPTCQYRTEGLPILTTNDKYRMKNTCLQMQDELHNKSKVPILKTTQFRNVYISQDKKINISIDTDIMITRCMNGDQIKFPYCIIQIEGEEEQDFISKLISNPMLEPVHDFSLYLHGVGTLLYDKAHVFPSWFSKMEVIDIRHTDDRGSLLFTQSLSSETTKSESSSSSEKPYWSSNTISTIITCYDADIDEEDEDHIKQTTSPSSLSIFSSSSSSSSLLSPIPKQQQGKLRRSFDSYCSFDHPTSSRSDPTNCKSCTGKLNQTQHKVIALKKKKHAENVTFFSVIKNLICQYKEEKEPLLPITTCPTHHTYFMGFSKASVITTSCVIISFIVSYLLYLFILKIK